MQDQPQKPKVVSRKTVYTSDWVNLHVDKVLFPTGKLVEAHHFIDVPMHGVCAVVLNDRDQVLMIRSYRYIQDEIAWEIPAGSFSHGEEAIEAAAREVREETGYDSSGHRIVSSYYPLTGISNARFHVVFCRAGDKVCDFDPDEVHSTEWMGRERIQKMIRSGEIRDGFSLNGLLFWLLGAFSPGMTAGKPITEP